MGYLGFLFEIKKKEKIVFIEKKNFNSNIVIGIKNKAQLSKVENALILNYDLSLKKFPIFDSANFIYGKISLSKETFVDYEHLTIWFNARKYKKLRQLFEEEIENDRELVKRIVEIFNYFK